MFDNNLIVFTRVQSKHAVFVYLFIFFIACSNFTNYKYRFSMPKSGGDGRSMFYRYSAAFLNNISTKLSLKFFKHKFRHNGVNIICCSFNMGPAHIVSFSSEFYYFIKYGVRQVVEQYEWLKRDLEASDLIYLTSVKVVTRF